MTDKQIEAEIQAKGLTAPRITPADIEANIAEEHYFTASHAINGDADWLSERLLSIAWQIEKCGASLELTKAVTMVSDLSRDINRTTPIHASLRLLTFCVLVLRNGFTVTGESACASPENFDAELGRKIARRNAEAKIWPLLGYQLRSHLERGMSAITK